MADFYPLTGKKRLSRGIFLHEPVHSNRHLRRWWQPERAACVKRVRVPRKEPPCRKRERRIQTFTLPPFFPWFPSREMDNHHVDITQSLYLLTFGWWAGRLPGNLRENLIHFPFFLICREVRRWAWRRQIPFSVSVERESSRKCHLHSCSHHFELLLNNVSEYVQNNSNSCFRIISTRQ